MLAVCARRGTRGGIEIYGPCEGRALRIDAENTFTAQFRGQSRSDAGRRADVNPEKRESGVRSLQLACCTVDTRHVYHRAYDTRAATRPRRLQARARDAGACPRCGHRGGGSGLPWLRSGLRGESVGRKHGAVPRICESYRQVEVEIYGYHAIYVMLVVHA
jgi:hypothetical protein